MPPKVIRYGYPHAKQPKMLWLIPPSVDDVTWLQEEIKEFERKIADDKTALESLKSDLAKISSVVSPDTHKALDHEIDYRTEHLADYEAKLTGLREQLQATLSKS